MKKIFLLLISILYVAFSQAQAPANDNCETALYISDIKSFCSKFNDPNFSTSKAKVAGFQGSCINQKGNDVWYSFVALATDINIVIKTGSGIANAGGTMKFPEAVLYSGDCSTSLSELECQKNSVQNIINLYQGGLTIGQTYYLQIQARLPGGTDGTFQLCIENYNPPKIPQGDCIEGSILCDKSSFIVQSVTGFGKDNKEISQSDAACFVGSTSTNVEMSSTWYKWTCDKSGTLTFVLTPNKEDDDIDFILFELPGGLNDCGGKTAVRCMASGDSYPSICMGPTGLREGENDLSETTGCGSGKNAFIKPLDMVAGKSYALMVNNFTSSNTGFKMSFGGTGTFLGPTAKFKTTTVKKVCFGEALTYEDQSFYSNGTIKKWSWNFGQAATPKNLIDLTKPPTHTVTYNTPGQKYVALTIESDKGCLITAIDSFTVDSCCSTVNKIKILPQIKDLACPDLLEGEIKLNPTVELPTTYTWDLGQTTPTITNLGAGQYKVTISNTATCDAVFTFDVKSPLPIITDTLLKKPTCNGGKDGIITLVPSGGKAPYEYDFGNGYTSSNTEKNLSIGKYPIFIKDINGCLKAVTVDLKELELNLDPTIKALKPPSCFGLSDGAITLNIFNGKSPFLYDFGSGFQNNNSISNLASGTYNIAVQDDNLCKGIFKFNVKQPDKIVLQADTVVISCNGANDGKGYVEATGGTGAYKYLWSDTKQQTTQNAVALAPGVYTVSVTDENNCIETIQVGLNQPPLLGVKGNLKNLLCYNDRTGEIQFIGEGGRPPYQFSLDGVVFQKNDLFKNLPAGSYSLIVRDTANCEFQIPVNLSQPSPLNAGSDQIIELGEAASLFAETSPVGKNVKSWAWTPDTALTCRDCPNPTAMPFRTTSYTIKAIDETGCPAVDRVTIVVSKPRRTFPPNVFSPGNDDGINDRFTIFTDRSAKKIQLMRIFDRWGDLIFEGTDFPPNDSNFGWNGTFRNKKAAEGVYTWIVLMEYLDGEVISYKGDVSLLR
jgi:gliding motility-associated-like protein